MAKMSNVSGDRRDSSRMREGDMGETMRKVGGISEPGGRGFSSQDNASYRFNSEAMDGQRVNLSFPKDNDSPGVSYQEHDIRMKGGPTNLSHSLSGVSAEQMGDSSASRGNKTSQSKKL
jgi:hypothetical protein